MATARELLDDYNYYRSFTEHVHAMRDTDQWVRFVKETPERLAAMARMSAWCEERRYDARHWLCWLFYRGHWRYARPFNQLVPGSKRTEKKLVEAYAKVTELPMFVKRTQQLSYMTRANTEQIYDGNRDMAATTEALKRRYLRMADPEGCMEDERSNGYHPRSLVCARCVLAIGCERKLRAGVDFDIVALRDGRMTAAQARAEVACRGR